MANERKTGENRACQKIGEQAAELVIANPWPKDIALIRNAIIHAGAFPIVFGEPGDGTLFQVFDLDKYSGRVGTSIFLVNGNVADFELYAAYWLANLFSFIDSFAKVVSESLKITLSPTSRLSSGGLETAYQWMDKLVNKLSSD